MKKYILIAFMIIGFGTSLGADEFEDEIKACERGSSLDCAAHALGYEMGIGTRKNPKKAFEYYKKAFYLGNVLGCQKIAKSYEIGIGTEKNMKEAIRINKYLCDKSIGGFAKKGCKKYKDLTE